MTKDSTRPTLNAAGIIQLIFRHWHIKMICAVIAVAIVYYYEIISLELRVISVPLEVLTNDVVLPLEQPPVVVRVNIRGEGEDILAITSDDIRAVLDLTEAEIAGEYAATIMLERVGIAKSINPVELEAEPSQLTVEMDLATTKEVEIVLQTVASSPRGYAVSQTAINPPVVSLTGPQRLLEDIETINTENINISQLTQSSVVRISLDFPHNYLSLTDAVAITAHFDIVELIVANSFDNIAIVVTDMRDDLTSNIDVYRGAIVIEGTPSSFALLPTDASFLFVDGSAISEVGNYILPVIAELPQQDGVLSVQSYTPTEVELAVTERTADSEDS